MSKNKEKRCCICGDPSTLKCSSCAKFNMEVLFCSAKHQEWFWPIHKQVCGARSNPFHWPPLFKAEVECLLEYPNNPFFDVQGPTKEPLPIQLFRSGIVAPNPEPVLRSLMKGRASPYSFEVTQGLIFHLRGLALTRRFCGPGETKLPDDVVIRRLKTWMLSRDAWDMTLSFAQMILRFPHTASSTDPKTPWWSTLMHKFLAMAHCLRSILSNPRPEPHEYLMDLYTWASWTIKEVEAMRRDVMKPTLSTEEMKSMKDYMDDMKKSIVYRSRDAPPGSVKMTDYGSWFEPGQQQ